MFSPTPPREQQPDDVAQEELHRSVRFFALRAGSAECFPIVAVCRIHCSQYTDPTAPRKITLRSFSGRPTKRMNMRKLPIQREEFHGENCFQCTDGNPLIKLAIIGSSSRLCATGNSPVEFRVSAIAIASHDNHFARRPLLPAAAVLVSSI